MHKADIFFKEKVGKIFTEHQYIVDIGGGLRISKKRGNAYSDKNEWLEVLAEKVQYKVLDPVDTYNPDIVGDIHKLPFEDMSVDAFICMSVLEHVENPIQAASELYRTLKKGGSCFVYVPFLYSYHAEPGYYGDFWRFTEDSVRHIFKDFKEIEIQQLRGALETWVNLSPLGSVSFIQYFARVADRLLGKQNSKQTSGYHVFLIK